MKKDRPPITQQTYETTKMYCYLVGRQELSRKIETGMEAGQAEYELGPMHDAFNMLLEAMKESIK